MPQGSLRAQDQDGGAAPAVPLTIGAYVVAAAVVLGGLWLASLASYPLFHSLAETFSIVVAWGLFIVAWNSRRFLAHGFLVFLGVALLATGAIDLAHMLAYKRMGVFPGDTADLATQLWIAARYLQAVSLLAAPLFLTRQVRAHALLAAYAAVTALLLAAVFGGWFPACFIEGRGLTPFKITSEYVVCGLLAGAMVFLYLRRAHLDRAVLRWVLAAEGVSIAAELAFTLYSDVYGLFNLLGHFLKIAAFVLLYKAVVETGFRRPYRLLFRELAQAEERLRLAVRAANEAIWDWDLVRNRVVWNPSYAQQFGRPAKTGSSERWWAEHIHPEDRRRVTGSLREAIAAGHESWSCEYRFLRPDGTWADILDRAYLAKDAAGRTTRAVGSMLDMTERKQAEEALQRAKRAAEAANEAKGRFVANVSHELRTPMNAILGMVDLALPRQADPTAREFLQTARSSADLLLALLNDLLDSAKIEAGKLELEAAPFSLRRVLDQTTQVLAVRASEKGIAFSCRIPPEVPDALVGDQVRLRQVLLNLGGNGVKFTERGEVTLKVRVFPEPRDTEGQDAGAAAEPRDAVVLPEAGEEVTLEFAVQDMGIGIPPSELERIFRPFAQADLSTTRRFGGTGLGLSICTSLVGMMGGRLRAESKPGRGSTFYFTVRLPRAKELPAEPEVPAIPAAAASPLRILLVEDNPANRKLARYILQERGHAVETANDGPQAIRLVQRSRYDVVLMDVQMPGMDGLEATRTIRACEEEGRRVPIIAMTAHAMEGDRQRCLAAGMDGYLPKPIQTQQMIGLVESLGGTPLPGPQAAVKATGPPETPPETTAETTAEAAAVFNRTEALARCFGSPEMVEQMAQCFFEEMESLFPQMRAAVEKEDLAEVGRLGHRMKGTLVYLGARPATEAAKDVERFHKAIAEDALDALEHECARLKAALIEHRLAARPAQGQ